MQVWKEANGAEELLLKTQASSLSVLCSLDTETTTCIATKHSTWRVRRPGSSVTSLLAMLEGEDDEQFPLSFIRADVPCCSQLS